MSTITANDGTQICYNDWGKGPRENYFERVGTQSRRRGRVEDETDLTIRAGANAEVLLLDMTP